MSTYGLARLKPGVLALVEKVRARPGGAYPLPAGVRDGWKRAAMANGYSVDGTYKPGGVARPTTVEEQAGWVLWHEDGWDTYPRKRNARRGVVQGPRS